MENVLVFCITAIVTIWIYDIFQTRRFKKLYMEELPSFLRNKDDEISALEYFDKNTKGWVFESKSKHQAAVFDFSEDGISESHKHDFEMLILTIIGEVTLYLNKKKIVLKSGQRYFIPSNSSYWCVFKKKTKIIIFSGGKL